MRVESYRADIPEPVIDQVADIYIECFTGPPRFEEWSVEKVKAHLRKLLTGEADLYVVVEGDSDVVSFGIGLAMADYFNAEELIEHGANVTTQRERLSLPQFVQRVSCRGRCGALQPANEKID